jgi:ribosomal protein L37AE/L43A
MVDFESVYERCPVCDRWAEPNLILEFNWHCHHCGWRFYRRKK